MCDTGTWRQVFCYWTGMLRSIPFSLGRSSGLIEGECSSDTGRNTFRIMLGGIEPLSVVVCLVSVLVFFNFMPFVWYFMKYCFRAIKNPDGEESQQYRQRREEIHEELHQDMSRQLQHHGDQNEYEPDGDLMEEPVYRYPNMVDSCVQVHPRNFPRRRVSLVSLRHAHSRVTAPRASCSCLHQGAAGDTAPPPLYGPASMREPECAWPPQHYDAPPGYSTCLRSSNSCAWIRYPPFSLHQASGMMPTPRLTRYPPLEVTTSHTSTYFKDEPTQTSTDDFVEALQKCRMIRQTRSGAVYSVYF